jgi:hypothetical protein
MSAIFGGRGDTRPLFFHLNWNQRFTAWILVALVFLGIISYVFELHRLENTLGAGKLIGWSFIVLLPFLAFIAWNLSKGEKGSLDKIRAFLIILFGVGIFIPLVGSFSNRLLSWNNWEIKSYEIFELEEYRENIEGKTFYDYDVFIVYQNNLERIELLKRVEPLQKGSVVEIRQKNGFWGFPYIDPYSHQINTPD